MTIKEYNSPVAENANYYIMKKGLKQCAVAEKAGYSKQAFSDMLNGRRLIKPHDISKLARALNVRPNDLFASDREHHAAN